LIELVVVAALLRMEELSQLAMFLEGRVSSGQSIPQERSQK